MEAGVWKSFLVRRAVPAREFQAIEGCSRSNVRRAQRGSSIPPPASTARCSFVAPAMVRRFRSSQGATAQTIASKSIALSAAKTRQLVPEGAVSTAKGAEQATHAANEYDWSGFYCPCCGYIPAKQDTDFVHCGTCSEFVCGESLTKNEATGSKYFRCYPACGGHGEISGTIDEYSGRQRTEANRPEYVSIGSEQRPRLRASGSVPTVPPGSPKR